MKGLGAVPLSASMSDPDESVEKVSVARKYRWPPTATLRYGSYLDDLGSYRSYGCLFMCCDGFVGSEMTCRIEDYHRTDVFRLPI